MRQFAIFVIKVFAWLNLMGGILLAALYLFVGSAIVFAPIGPAGPRLPTFGGIAVFIAALIPFLAGLFLWAVLMCLATITESLIDIRNSVYGQRSTQHF